MKVERTALCGSFLWVGLGGDIPYLVHRVWYDTDRKGEATYEESK